MDKEHPVIMEQRFEGTAQELIDILQSYVVDHAPRTGDPIGPSDIVELQAVPDDPGVFLMVRHTATSDRHEARAEQILDEFGRTHKQRIGKGDRLQFAPLPPVEGTLRVRQITADPPRAKFVCRAYTEACRELALALAREVVVLGAARPNSPERPVKPDKPQPGAGVNLWFDWYHAMKDQGFKCSLEEIAKDLDRTYGSVRQLHAAYASERGLSTPRAANANNKRTHKN